MSITEVPLAAPTDPRRLRVDFLHYPRSFRANHFRWDLDRGFRLEVLGKQCYWFCLLDPQVCQQVSRPEAQPSEQDFFLHVCRSSRGEWPAWPRQRLATGTVCVILSESGQACKVPSDWPNLVLWVRQPMLAGTVWTGNDFFTPEQTLYQWGRVGRRVQRRARWRPLLPW